MTKGVGAFFRNLLKGPFGGEGDKNACRPLPIPANLGFAIPVSAGPPSPADSVKFDGASQDCLPFSPSDCDDGRGYSVYDGFEALEYNVCLFSHATIIVGKMPALQIMLEVVIGD